MSHAYNGNPASFTAAITLPDDGDAKNASSVNTPLEGLADQVAYLKNVTDVVGVNAIRNGTAIQMVAITAPPDGTVFNVLGIGMYTFKVGSIAANDSLLVIPSTDATGKWIHALGFGANSNQGFVVVGAATAPGGRILASLVPNRLVALAFISSIPSAFTSSSSTPVDITGYGVSLTCVAGDVLLIDTSISWIIAVGGSGQCYSELAVVDGGTTTVIATENLVQLNPPISAPVFGYSKFTRAYVVINSGTVTVKGRVRGIDPTDTISMGKGIAPPDHASIVVQQIRA